MVELSHGPSPLFTGETIARKEQFVVALVAERATIAIVGAGLVGLAALVTAQFYAPAALIMIDADAQRLAVAKSFGSTALINSSDGNAARQVT